MARDASLEPTHAGQAIYSPLLLAFYDFIALGVSNRFVWRCPTRRMLELYDRHVTADHLDVGVGTGWFLDRCEFGTTTPRLALMDLHANPLAAAAHRTTRYAPQTYERDVLRPIAFDGVPFRSIGITYVLHCLPGTMREKAAAFDNVLPLLRADGVLFGATLLSVGVRRTAAARALMRLYNRLGIFSNATDSLDDLRDALLLRFREVELETIGSAALFYARGPRVKQ